MSEILMIYHIPDGDASTRISFNRKLLCYRVQSNSGKFDKKTEGLLKNYKKPVRSTLIFDKTKYECVKQLCDEFKIKSQFYEIKEVSD
jgi:hypothetical protein